MTHKALRESISAQHETIVEDVDAFIAKMVSTHSPDADIGRKICRQCSILHPLVPAESRPDWLNHIHEQFSAETLAHGRNLPGFSQFVLSHVPGLKEPIVLGDDALFDFDSVFAEVRDEKSIPEVFDNLVQQLEKIIVEGVLDSKTVEEALIRLKALLNRNRRGSLVAILMSMNYGRFVLSAFRNTIAANKYLKPTLEAFEAEFAKAEQIVNEANEETKKQVIARLTNGRRLEGFIEEHNVDRERIKGFLPEPEPTNPKVDGKEPG